MTSVASNDRSDTVAVKKTRNKVNGNTHAYPTNHRDGPRLVSNFVCDMIEEIESVARQTSRSTTDIKPTVYISSINDDGHNTKIDDVKTRAECTSSQKRKSAHDKAIATHGSSKGKCERFKGRHICKESFDTWDAKMYHVTTYHVKGIRTTFGCHLCKKSFARKWRTQNHIRSIHAGLKLFKCPSRSCSKSFSEKGNLIKHIDAVHSRLRPFTCPFQMCPKRFAAKQMLQRHMNTVHSKSK